MSLFYHFFVPNLSKQKGGNRRPLGTGQSRSTPPVGLDSQTETDRPRPHPHLRSPTPKPRQLAVPPPVTWPTAPPPGANPSRTGSTARSGPRLPRPRATAPLPARHPPHLSRHLPCPLPSRRGIRLPSLLPTPHATAMLQTTKTTKARARAPRRAPTSLLNSKSR